MAGAVIALTALLAVALHGGGQVASSVQGRPESAPRVTIVTAGDGGGAVGAQGPALSAATVSGTTFRLPAGKPAIVYFMAGWCGSCVPESQALSRIDRQEHGKIAILAVDADPTDPLSSLENFIHQVGDPGYSFAQDEGGKLVQAFGATALDATVVLDGSGRVVYRSTVPIDDRTLRAALTKAGLS